MSEIAESPVELTPAPTGKAKCGRSRRIILWIGGMIVCFLLPTVVKGVIGGLFGKAGEEVYEHRLRQLMPSWICGDTPHPPEAGTLPPTTLPRPPEVVTPQPKPNTVPPKVPESAQPKAADQGRERLPTPTKPPYVTTLPFTDDDYERPPAGTRPNK